MNKMTFKVNYKTFYLFYTNEQRANIEYMDDWKNTIKRLRYLIKNNLTDSNNCGTHYIAKAIDNYEFYIERLVDNQFIIKDGTYYAI